MSSPDNDPEPSPEAAPWAMQLAARIEKVDPPTTAEVCAASVRAVIGLLRDERAGDVWAEPIATWQSGGRIRKLVRRGRASAWTRAQEVEGVTARSGRAEVRAYVPCRMDRVPEAVAKLQIRSTELDEPERSDQIDTPSTGRGGLIVVLTPDVVMSWGKQAAQSAHAGQLLWQGAGDGDREAWLRGGEAVTVVHATVGLWRALLDRTVVDGTVVVRDGGFTEIPAGTLTAVATWSPEVRELAARLGQ